MANVDRVNGFRPIRHTGSPWNGQVTRYYVTADDTTAIFVGDMVKLDGGNDGKGVRSCTQATVTAAVVGVVAGIEVSPTDLNLSGSYRAASTGRYIFVVDDPDAFFEAQEDGTMGVASVGLNSQITIAAGNTTTGSSGMEIDSSETGTTATNTIKLIEVVQREDNDGTLANARWIVKINNHQMGTSTGTAGV
jgi:hypothetical protein